MALLAKRERYEHESEQQFKERLEEEFKMAMGWIPCAGADKKEYGINLTIGQMNVLEAAIKCYIEKEFSKDEKDLSENEKITLDYNDVYGYGKANCNIILSKIRAVQEHIFNYELSGADIDHMHFHHCIGGTIQ